MKPLELVWPDADFYVCQTDEDLRRYRGNLQRLTVTPERDESIALIDKYLGIIPDTDWHARRMARNVASLVRQEQPTSDEEWQAYHDEWYERGYDAVLMAMRYYRKKRKRQGVIQ